MPGAGTVLVVEDEAQVRGMVVRTLTRCGYEVIAAENGVEALALYEGRRKPIDLVVLDMIMPRMNGWDCYPPPEGDRSRRAGAGHDRLHHQRLPRAAAQGRERSASSRNP